MKCKPCLRLATEVRFIKSFISLHKLGLYPKSIYANCLVVIQSFIGLFTSTIVVALSVAKFSRPTNKKVIRGCEI